MSVAVKIKMKHSSEYCFLGISLESTLFAKIKIIIFERKKRVSYTLNNAVSYLRTLVKSSIFLFLNQNTCCETMSMRRFF